MVNFFGVVTNVSPVYFVNFMILVITAWYKSFTKHFEQYLLPTSALCSETTLNFHQTYAQKFYILHGMVFVSEFLVNHVF